MLKTARRDKAAVEWSYGDWLFIISTFSIFFLNIFLFYSTGLHLKFSLNNWHFSKWPLNPKIIHSIFRPPVLLTVLYSSMSFKSYHNLNMITVLAEPLAKIMWNVFCFSAKTKASNSYFKFSMGWLNSNGVIPKIKDYVIGSWLYVLLGINLKKNCTKNNPSNM